MNKGRTVTANWPTPYPGNVDENFYITLQSGGFFNMNVMNSGISPEAVVNGWEGSAGHLATMLSPAYKICGAAIFEWQEGIY